MKIEWIISKEDVEKLNQFVSSNENNFVKVRRQRNINQKDLTINKDSVVKTLLMCLLTSQQRSGPESKVAKFLRKEPFPLTYSRINQMDGIEDFTKDVLVSNDLNRYRNRISTFFSTNIQKFEEDKWMIIEELNELLNTDSKFKERVLADKLSKELKGIGPKQSRNFLQLLGVTKYEIPIDSRITNWFNDFGFPVALNSLPLGDNGYYHFVQDGIQKLCKEAKIYPCILDATIFSSFDNDEWTLDNIVF